MRQMINADVVRSERPDIAITICERFPTRNPSRENDLKTERRETIPGRLRNAPSEDSRSVSSRKLCTICFNNFVFSWRSRQSATQKVLLLLSKFQEMRKFPGIVYLLFCESNKSDTKNTP